VAAILEEDGLAQLWGEGLLCLDHRASVADVFEALGRPGWPDPVETRDHPGCPVEEAVNNTIATIETEAGRHVLARYGALSLDDIAREVTRGK